MSVLERIRAPWAARAKKRLFDLGVSGGLLLLCLPATPLLAAAIKLDSPGPVFFFARRLGRSGRPIGIWKLRTMVDKAPERFQADGSRLVEERDPRVTRLGRILRAGFDELPQLWAVVKGDMSLVGPRPDDLFAADMYQGVEWLKLAARPGLTGLAQVSGRTELPWRERLKYDAYYVTHQSLGLDLRIIWRTFAVVLKLPRGPDLVSADEVAVSCSEHELLVAADELRRAFAADFAGKMKEGA